MNRKKPVQSIMHTQGPKKGCSKLLGSIYMMFRLVTFFVYSNTWNFQLNKIKQKKPYS